MNTGRGDLKLQGTFAGVFAHPGDKSQRLSTVQRCNNLRVVRMDLEMGEDFLVVCSVIAKHWVGTVV
jgi:hypothetical protein